MLKRPSTGYNTFVFIFLLGVFSIGNWIDRDQTLPLFLAFFSALLGYLFILQEKENFKLLVGIGLLARLILFFTMPSLSDDIYRFIWDGLLSKNGLNPYTELPSYYLNTTAIPGINSELFNHLNSSNYFSVYPPLNQFLFWISIACTDSWLTATNLLRALLLLADVGSLLILQRLLFHYGKPKQLAFWYFLNPLVILEFTGNIHFEGLVIFLVLVGIYFLEKNRGGLSAASLGLAIATKLLPLIYLPYLFILGLRNRRWWVAISAGLIAILTLLPMLNHAFISSMQSSLDLYFRNFEFNASLYFIAREVGLLIYGYNNIAFIGPLLALLSFSSILFISILGNKRQWSIPKTLLFILTTYLLFTTTVHPWYVLPLIAFGLLSGYWYPIVWSLMIFLTYLGYSKEGFELPLFIVFVEYAVIAVSICIEQIWKRNTSYS